MTSETQKNEEWDQQQQAITDERLQSLAADYELHCTEMQGEVDCVKEELSAKDRLCKMTENLVSTMEEDLQVALDTQVTMEQQKQQELIAIRQIHETKTNEINQKLNTERQRGEIGVAEIEKLKTDLIRVNAEKEAQEARLQAGHDNLLPKFKHCKLTSMPKKTQNNNPKLMLIS